MWIRNQTETMLYNETREIYVSRRKNGYEVMYVVCCIDYELGKYSTEKKAIKVLQMIEEHINKGTPIVFKMPKDEEVSKDD